MDETDITTAVVSRTMPHSDVGPRSPPVCQPSRWAQHL